MSTSVGAAADMLSWIGTTDSSVDMMVPYPAQALAATLDIDGLELSAGNALPPLWHWLYHLPLARGSEMGPDGHPKRGGFLPPIELPRRMFAGARVRFLAPICIGATVHRERKIAGIERKDGKAGPLYVVTVHHTLRLNNAQGPALLEEEQDLIFTGSQPSVPQARAGQNWEIPAGATVRKITPNPVLLFRFSALTFNAHRIHYDLPYARDEEGYPALVVHGPLTAIVLADLARRHLGGRMKSFSFRAKSPLFSGEEIMFAGWIEGEHYTLSARRASDGTEAMAALAQSNR